MNRYPLWKNLLIVFVVVMGFYYALPNIFGQSPVVQVSPEKSAPVDASLKQAIEQRLKDNNIPFEAVVIDNNSVLIKFNSLDDQLKAKDVLETLKGYRAALNLKPNVPGWLVKTGGKPMNLGLDLRGGVHFLLQVDMDAAEKQLKEQLVSDIRQLLKEDKISNRAIKVDGRAINVRLRSAADLQKAYDKLRTRLTDLAFSTDDSNGDYWLIGKLKEQALVNMKNKALEQNLTTLRSRVNELGVAEPQIQQQGSDRIVVELPGIQDTAKAKRLLDATATLEYRAVDMEHNAYEAERTGRIPVGYKLYHDKQGNPVLLKKRVIASGNQLINASSGVDQQTGTPMVSVTLNSLGAKRMLEFTKKNVGNNMAVVYKERIPVGKDPETGKTRYKDSEVVISNARINGVFSSRFQTTGLDSMEEATQLALLLRAGALAAPVEIVEERTVGPSLGQENIEKGFKSVVIGFIIVLIFMAVYYKVFGLIADVALALNLVLIVAILSLLGATLTLPGIAGIVLTVGMAVDANVLIFERIKEELRAGTSIQTAIKAGYEKAFSTIADANITTLIAAIVLFAFGTGPIKGFAITLGIGILTSMFTAIMVTRALINWLYGRKKHLRSIPI